MKPVIHHCQLCVRDVGKTLKTLRKYGFAPFAERKSEYCYEVAARLSSVVFVVTEKAESVKCGKSRDGSDPLTILCSRCEDETNNEHVDTVFNVALNVKDVKLATERVKSFNDSYVIQPPSVIEDKHGSLEYSVIKSNCGNVVHLLVNTDNYEGFLPGFTPLTHVDISDATISSVNKEISHIDHVTLACHSGYSEKVMDFYQNTFNMEKFSISRDDKDDGLIIKEGVGLRLRAMEYWMCSESTLVYSHSPLPSSKERSPNSMMIVVVESLPGQRNCNVETFLKEHRSDGIEHIALSCQRITETVSKMSSLGVEFRLPPLRRMPELSDVSSVIDMSQIEKYGILLDKEDPDEDDDKPKYLMQIFAKPFFGERKTFFIEVIQRLGATGLGAGNILALVRSIREDERRKAAEGEKIHFTKDSRTKDEFAENLQNSDWNKPSL